MALNPTQESEVAFISGFNADGTLSSPSFATWNRGNGAPTYSTTSSQTKWGGTTAGTPGGNVTYSFVGSFTQGQ